MVRDGSIARTPEELDAWISQAPDARESLERGGYGTAFTSEDLFPLLQVFVLAAGGSAPEGDAPPRSSQSRWLVGLLLVLIAVLFLVAVAADAIPQQAGVGQVWLGQP